MRLVFAGTPDFARAAFEALADAGHEIVLAMTQPDRPSGRGMKVVDGPVKAAAVARGIPVIQPHGLRIGGKYDGEARDAHERLRATPHDAMIVAAYGLILPQGVLDIPPLGCLNIHASLLPRWRGAAPIQRAIEAGDAETGITIMRMDAGLDTGPMLTTHPVPIGPNETGGSLTARLAALGGEAIVDALVRLARGELVDRPQHAPGDDGAVTYAAKIAKSESALDFSDTSRRLVDRVRAFDPWPGCAAVLITDDGTATPYKIWRAHTVSLRDAAVLGGRDVDALAPGRVIGLCGRSSSRADPDGQGVLVRTADGVVALTELQKPGGKRLPVAAFARDFPLGASARFAPD